MSLEKSIEKLTKVITVAKMGYQPMVNSPEPKPIGLPDKKAICTTEYFGTYPHAKPMCVCRFGKDCIVQSWDGPCTLNNYETTVPMNTPCQ
jgi:hypothetical protein